MQLFLMKRGGEEIYVGPVGRHSCELIKYFEVRIQMHKQTKLKIIDFTSIKLCSKTSVLPKRVSKEQAKSKTDIIQQPGC